MSGMTLWHNPRCSKSRQALKLLEDRGITPTVRRYLDAPPTAREIAAVRAALGVPAIAMMRTNERAFREAGLRKDMEDRDLIAAMAAHPILIERPIAISGGRAVIGRPPEAVLRLL